MSKKYMGLALTVVFIGGYVYYRYNKAEIDKRLQQVEDKAAEVLLNWQAKTDSLMDE